MKKNIEIIKNLISAMVDYGQDACWNDSDIIEELIGCGITEQDFKDCGYYWTCVKEYFEND